MDWKKYLEQTEFARDTDKIVNVFRVGKIVTYEDLQNAPIKIGALCYGYSTYVVIAQLNAAIAAEKAGDVPVVAEAKTASKAVEATAEPKTEQPKKAATEGKRSGSRARSDAAAEKADKA